MEYYDDELGKIIFRRNARAKRIVLRTKPDSLVITLPYSADIKEGLEAIEEFRADLLKRKEKNAHSLLNEETQLVTLTFSVHIFRTKRANFYFSLKDTVLHIACPEDTDYANPNVQNLLHKNIEHFLRIEAKRVLPQRLQELAQKYGFHFNQVKINNSKGRWGSCSTKKIINLSYFMMLLPQHLIDYVLLHELTHTLEMNHSERFWKHLDNITDNQSLLLREELRRYKTHI